MPHNHTLKRKRVPVLFLTGLLLITVCLSACQSSGSDSKTRTNTNNTTQKTTTAHNTPTAQPNNAFTGVQIPSHPAPTPTPAPTKTQPTQAVPTKASTTPSTNNPASWSLIFSDDFNGPALDPTWGRYDGPHGGGKSYYKPDEITLSNGMVHIAIDRKVTNGLPYTSGGMAAFRLAQTYGKYEFRAKLPYGKGIDPYSILWENTAGHGDVEVDLFESPPIAKDKLYFTNHGKGDPSQIIANGDFAANFHTFTYEWQPGKLRMLVDGVEQGVLTKNVPDFPMWFAMAISSGDAFTGDPDSTTTMPVTLDVDWVRIYKYVG